MAIAMETKNQITAAVETLSNDSTALRFQVGFDKASQRGNAIKARIAEFQKVGLAEAAAMLSALKTELSAHEKLLKSKHRSPSVKRQNVEQLEMYFESLKSRLEELDRQIRTRSSQTPQILAEFDFLAQEQKMLIPPRLQPTTYKIDPVTGQKVVDHRPSKCEIQMYMVEKTRYQEQRQQLSNRMSEVMRKMKNGSELHNETLAIRKQERELGKEIEWAKRVRYGVEDDVAEAERKRNILAERLLISRFALADVSSQSSKSKSCFRPSRFDLMDYKDDAWRLTKALR